MAVQEHLDSAIEKMKKTVQHTHEVFSKIRAGRAMPNMLGDIKVEYYGTPTPLSQVASVSTSDARTLNVKPWEKTMLKAIEKAIINSDLGLAPQNDGELIRLNIPPLTEERRKELVKQVKHEAENGKISVRSIRKEANEHIKKLLKEHISEDEIKDAEQEIQELTDKHISNINDLAENKEKEIMTV